MSRRRDLVCLIVARQINTMQCNGAAREPRLGARQSDATLRSLRAPDPQNTNAHQTSHIRHHTSGITHHTSDIKFSTNELRARNATRVLANGKYFSRITIGKSAKFELPGGEAAAVALCGAQIHKYRRAARNVIRHSFDSRCRGVVIADVVQCRCVGASRCERAPE